MKRKFLTFEKISFKLTIVYALVFSVVLIMLNACVLYGVKYFVIDQSARVVDGTSNNMVTRIKETYAENKTLKNIDLSQEVQPKQNIYIRLLDKKGNIISIYPKDNISIPQGKPVQKTIKIENREKHLIYRDNIVSLGNNTTVSLIIVKDMEREYLFLKILFVLMALSDIVGIIIALISGSFISKKMLKPIDNIAKTAQSISIKDLNKRIEVSEADDELSRLAKTFNDMIQRLQESFEKQNKFVSDASHELRTPISIIKGYVNLLDRWGKDDKEILQEAIDTIKNETDNMTNLIERLLFLARGDSGRMKIEKEKFSLDEIINEVIKESKIIAPEHHIYSEVNEPIKFFADSKLIKQMIRALVDNSIKYTTNSGDIKINSALECSNVVILIEDSGIGIPEEEIPNLFNRFYRVDKARSKETGGSGLGLSIVKWIVDYHNGTIDIKSKQKVGTSVLVKLPIEKS
jgi:heavy metal sensor kinase